MKQHFTVLGSSGFVGCRLVQRLTQLGMNFWAPSRQDPDILKMPLGVVFYCIGLTADYAERPFDTVQAHVGYLAKLLENANFEHIVYLSSTRLYDGLSIEQGSHDSSLVFNPNDPRHLYDLSKALGENLCLTTSSSSSIARLSCVFDFEPNSPGFLSGLLQRLHNEKSFTINSSAGYCRDYITLDDTVASLIAMGEQRAQGIFNVASGINTYNQDLSDALRPLGFDIRFSRNDIRTMLPRCDISHLQALGIFPVSPLKAIIENISP